MKRKTKRVKKYDHVYEYQNDKGSPVFRYRIKYVDDNGKRRELSKTFKTAKEAYIAGMKVSAEIAKNNVDALSGYTITVKKACDYYIECREKENLSESYLYNIKRYITLFKNSMGDLRLSQVNKQNFTKHFLPVIADFNPNSQKTILTMINGMFNFYVENEKLDKNKIATVKIKGEKSQVNEAPTEEEIKATLTFLSDHKNEYMDMYFGFNFVLRSFCRIGEVLALRWVDIDKKRQIANIHATRTQYGYSNKTKTGQSRAIPLGDTLWKIIEEYETYKMNRYKALGRTFNENDYIFTNKSLNPYSKKTLDAHLDKVFKLVGCEKHHTWHSLRHAGATYAIANGGNIKSIQRRLGHSTPTTTLNFYTDEVKRFNQMLAQDVDDIFDNKMGK